MADQVGDGMNLNQLAEELGMERREFSELIELFLEASASDLLQIRSAFDRGESLAAAMAAHSIKGAALNLGLTEIYELARKIEEEARGNPSHRTPSSVLTLREKLDQIAGALKEQAVV